jgi:thiol-disulfide isomerase/thioredoxin
VAGAVGNRADGGIIPGTDGVSRERSGKVVPGMKRHHGGTETWRTRKFWFLLYVVLLLNGCTSETTIEAVPVSDFAVRSLNGEQIQLADLRGRWVVLNFWATWCAPCVAELPLLQQLAERHADQLTVLAVNMREDEAEVRAFVVQHNLSLPILLEPDDQTLLEYGVQGLPLSIVVSPDGEVLQRHLGLVDQAFQAWLEQAMAKT